MVQKSIENREISLYNALEDVKGSTIKQRADGLRNLKAIFDRANKAENFNILTDKAYHKIYEDTFRVVLTEKQNYLVSKKTTKANALLRLQACADAVRIVVKAGASKLKPKTVEAVIDHITQTLPNADGEYCEPLALHYLKALSGVLEQKANVERLKPSTWVDTVEFCLRGINQYLDDNEGEPSGLSRSFSGLGTINLSGSLPIRNGRARGQTGSVSRQNVEDLLQTLSYLLSAPNAPLLERSEAVANTIMRFLSSQGSTVSQLHQVAFFILNAVLSFTREDQISLSRSIAQEVTPIICRFWQGKVVAKDEMLNSVRDEMLILLFYVHLHLERCIIDEESTDLASSLSDLLDVVRAEYAKRSERDQLQLDDLDMVDVGSATIDITPFLLHAFRLRPHNTRAERNWANLHVIGILERLVNLAEQRGNLATGLVENDVDKHPRKRQRTSQSSDRLLGSLISEDENVRRAGLQILPFVLHESQLSESALSELLLKLSSCASDKRGHIASWALLAITSCTRQRAATQNLSADWMQLWHIGTRALTFSPTCRAAATQLHALLSTGLVQYHDIAEDVDAMITAADVSGPVVLCDSAIFLMMHLLHVRVTEVPGTSLIACYHVIRWLFSRWNPAERSFAVHSTAHVQPHYLIDLLRTSLGLPRLAMPLPTLVTCGSVAQAWQLHLATQDVVRYILLLDDQVPIREASQCSSCPKHSKANIRFPVLDTSQFQSTRKLILELLLPKLSDLLQSWKDDNEDRLSLVSTDTFRQSIYACITLLLLKPHFADTASTQQREFQTDLQNLIKELLNFLRDSDTTDPKGTQILVETLLQSVQPYLPPCGSKEFTELAEKAPDLLQFFITIADILNRRRLNVAPLSAVAVDDMMDLDDDFPTQQNHGRMEGQKAPMPRHDLALAMSSGSFYVVTGGHLMLLAAMSDTPEVSGFVPSTFIDQLLSMNAEELLSCRNFLKEMLQSDLAIEDADAARLIEHLGGILSSDEYDRCEIAIGICLDVLVGLGPLWARMDGGKLAESSFQLYGWLINVALHKEIASPEVQKGIARLLLLLLRTEDEYGVALSMPSPRSSLFHILLKGNVSVKFYIGNQLPEIFELFTLKAHDGVFVDVLENLPSDPDSTEGIAFRLFVLAKLASKWATLLRRCIYHIFETPGRIPLSVSHATRCLITVSSELKVEGPRELFKLFAPQILYTWLESEIIEDIPFQIFGFPRLEDLVADAQEEATALMIMRGQDQAAERLAAILRLTEVELLRNCFTKVIAYSVAYDMSVAPSDTPKKHATGEARVRKRLGQDLFFECINLHFADIVALLFNIIDHGDVEKSFMKKEDLVYAGKILKEIKAMSSSDVALPPNQQPTFKARYLTFELQHLCSRTEYESSEIYTPALVTFISRKLLNTVHPALGSLHACSVLRKLRILISLSGNTAVDGYPLEMLLHSIRTFITDPECADDAIGIAQYLMTRGSTHLSKSFPFVAGIALSIFGSLRVFLQSTPASTTQESQYKETMSKAQRFHTWMGSYVNEYNSPMFKPPLKSKFRALVQSAYAIGSAGNADTGTPESDLLFRLLEDEQTQGCLLNRPSRELAFAMLCSEFQIPASFRSDILGNDDLAIANAAVVWKSCKGESAGKQYLSWAARVIGRAFAASGHIHQELIQESTLSQMKELSISLDAEDSSEACVLSLLQALTLGHDRRTVGLAEAALRVIVTTSDESLLQTCQRSLSQALNVASNWTPYHIPPSEILRNKEEIDDVHESLAANAILRPCWLHDLTIFLALSVPDDPVLPALVPILRDVPGFAELAFPFIVHLVLSTPSQSQHSVRKQLSSAFASWFWESKLVAKNYLKMLINSLLYLRTQPLPQEKSSADRSHWLDVDYLRAATAATHCGMFKTALLFIEQFYSELAESKSSRRSSTIDSEPPEMPTEVLLNIFQNIDDPDLYYGVQQNASLSTIQARLEYEKDGPKSLAFRGAQYDSHVRRRNPESAQDVQSLVKALDVLSLSGLSYSLLQAQQTVGMSTTSLESMFRTARKLEQWDIPVPSTCTNNPVTIYKAFQAINTSPDFASVMRAINEGFDCTIASLVREDHSASALHGSLQTLAALVEMDEVFSSQGSEQFEELLSRFQSRQDWMKIGSFEDISQILSCRGTTLSTLSQQPRLHKIVNIQAVDTRLVEVQTALLASELNRAHNALQESLSLATSLMDLIPRCRDVGLNVDVAIHVEAANALWDQGEMASSIGMLQALEKDSTSLKKQNIPVGRSDLLSKIGHQVSVARLEKPDRILENYLKPALHELKGKNEGSEAGQVFHQFAVFCDQQLQDADSLEDLERLKKLSMMKRDEVKELTKIVSSTVSHTEKNRVKGHLSKARTWLKLDEEELQRHMSSRDEFLRQSLENYLLALSASDDHDNNTLRFSALWLEHSEQTLANEAVSKHLTKVASRKFAPLMNQLTSRLQDTTAKFQQLLFSLVLRIATDHPFHGMYQIYAGASSRANAKDETALLRHAAAVKVSKQLGTHQKAGQIWMSISATNKVYCQLAAEKDDQKYKSGRRVALKESPAGSRLSNMLSKFHIPSPTLQVDLATDLDYSKVPVMVRFDPQMAIASGVSAPKVITALANNGAKFKQLVKGGNDDLRQDAIMEQVFEQVSELLKTNRSTKQRNLSIRTYKVLPLTSVAGIIEFVPNTIPLHEYLMPAHEKYYPKDLKGNQCRKEISDVQTQSHDVRVKKFRSVTERFHPVMRYFFTEKFDDPDEWFVKRLAYTRSTAAISILGHVLGLGDRHGHNILLDAKSGEVVHIDLGVAFEMGRVLPVPELVPFRLTRDIVDGMGITKTEGVFRRCCEFTLEALRKEAYSIMTILDVLRYDPLYSWSISPVRLAKLQEGQSAAPDQDVDAVNERTKEVVNEPGEADRALTVVNKKLSKTLSVTATVNDLINQASDEKNLAVLYSGWAAYA